LPFKWALKNSALINFIDLQEDIPSICAQKLKFKQVDMALVPVAMLKELDHYFIESDYCIGANGKVDSVKLYSEVPLQEIEHITLDYQSRSSITLTRILAKFFWKIHPKFIEGKPGFENEVSGTNANVVIGDRTFDLNGKFAYEIDLAEEWKKFTDLPFVFAAWISHNKLNPAFIHEFNSVLKYGLENCEKAIESAGKDLLLSREDALEYLTERIDYNLDDRKLEAMKLFLEYIAKLND
jgi:chorismate dehydratase